MIASATLVLPGRPSGRRPRDRARRRATQRRRGRRRDVALRGRVRGLPAPAGAGHGGRAERDDVRRRDRPRAGGRGEGSEGPRLPLGALPPELHRGPRALRCAWRPGRPRSGPVRPEDRVGAQAPLHGARAAAVAAERAVTERSRASCWARCTTRPSIWAGCRSAASDSPRPPTAAAGRSPRAMPSPTCWTSRTRTTRTRRRIRSRRGGRTKTPTCTANYAASSTSRPRNCTLGTCRGLSFGAVPTIYSLLAPAERSLDPATMIGTYQKYPTCTPDAPGSLRARPRDEHTPVAYP